MYTIIMYTIINPVRRCLFPFLLYLLIPLDIHARVDFFCTNDDPRMAGMGVLADSLFLGASFIYLGSEGGATVAIINSDADWEGSLYFMVPGFPDSAYYLFTNKPANHPNDPARVNLSMIFDIPIGATITFMYVVVGYQSMYTGENRPGIDQYVSNQTHSSQGVANDRRWCTAGRIKDANGQPTDSAEFTFEDAPNGDFDFNDIIFRVKGLGLNIEDTLSRIDSAIVYDAVGNGIGDSLVIFFDFADTARITSVDLIWPQAAPVQQLDITPLHLESSRIISIPYTPASQEVVTEGTGEVTVGLDSLNTVVSRKSDALDGIGPLLKDEALLVRRYIPDNDTFFVSFTENVAVSEIMGTSFILIKKDDHREIELTLLDPAVGLGSQDSITFAIADLGSDAPEAGDSLKILHTGPVVDTPRRNHAHPDNTPVPIILIDRPTQVTVITGYYFDNDAEGYVDSIYVEATTNLPGGLTDVLVQELIDNALTFPASRNFTVNSSGVTSGGFFIKVTEDNTHNPMTYVTLEDKLTVSAYTLSIGANVTAITADIIDKVAPIIHWEPKSALLVDYQVASKSDTLGVKFSEPVENVTADEPFYFLDTDNNSNYSVTLLPVNQPKSDSMVFHVVSVSGVAEMQHGDSIWIRETDLVTDVEGNSQNNTANIKRMVYIDNISGSVDIAKAYYFDNNADGYVDSIYVEATTDIEGGFTAIHVSELVANAITFPDFRGFTTAGSGVTSGGFYIIVTEDQGHNPFTYITGDDILQIKDYTFTTGGTVTAKTVTVYDRVAPIIHWEDKAAYLIDFQVDSIQDSLTIKFSEPVTDVTHEYPFFFLSMEENSEYQVQLNHVSHNNDIMKFTVKDYSPVTYMRDGDSVWIQQTDRVGDIIDPINYQNNNSNTKRKLWIERRLTPFDLIPNSTSPINISNPDNNSIIPSGVVDIINNIDPNWLNNNQIQTNSNGDFIGMVITVKPDKDPDILLPDFELEGYLSIFDAVGNQLVSKEKMLWWDEQKTLIWVWDGKNMNDRNVGSGSYLAIAEIEEVTTSLDYDKGGGPKQVKKLFIGVME